QVPYNALILAREKMKVYAYVSIIQVVLKLVASLLLIWYGTDKLVLYAVLTFFIVLIVNSFYQIYCRRVFEESRYKFDYDKVYFKELLAYSSWNVFGTISAVFKNQGVNIVLNFFFGTVINAAYGIAMQVQGAVLQFVYN